MTAVNYLGVGTQLQITDTTLKDLPINSVSYSLGGSEVDVTSLNSARHEYLPGLADTPVISFSGNYDANDAATIALLASAGAKTSVVYKVIILNGSGTNKTFTFTAFVNSEFVVEAGGFDDPVTYSCSLRVQGAVTEGTT